MNPAHDREVFAANAATVAGMTARHAGDKFAHLYFAFGDMAGEQAKRARRWAQAWGVKS